MSSISTTASIPKADRPDPWAQDLANEGQRRYVERYTSGDGLRIIGGTNSTEKLHRKWPVKDGREKAAIEIYRNCERYITITGVQLGECKELSQLDLLDQIKAHYSGEESSAKKTANGKSGPGFDFNQADPAANAIDWDAVIQNGAPPNADVSAVFHSVVGHLSAKGLSVEEIINELGKWPNGIGQRYAGRLRSGGRALIRQVAVQALRSQSGPGQTGGQNEPEEEAGWAGTRKGIPLSNGTNARRALKALGIKCRYDVFHDKIEVRGKNLIESVNLDHVALMLRIKMHKAFKFDPGTKHVLDAMIQLAIENKFDPVADYLNALVWDGAPRLDRWLATYLGAEDTELNRRLRPDRAHCRRPACPPPRLQVRSDHRARRPDGNAEEQRRSKPWPEPRTSAIRPSSEHGTGSSRSCWPACGCSRLRN